MTGGQQKFTGTGTDPRPPFAYGHFLQGGCATVAAAFASLSATTSSS